MSNKRNEELSKQKKERTCVAHHTAGAPPLRAPPVAARASPSAVSAALAPVTSTGSGAIEKHQCFAMNEPSGWSRRAVAVLARFARLAEKGT